MWGNFSKDNDVLTEDDLTPKIQKHIRGRFTELLRKSHKKRICDKTPRNSLRIPFIKAVFPDAKIIFIIRDGRSVIRSIDNSLTPSKSVIWREVINRAKRIPVWEWHLYSYRIGSIFKRIVGQPLNYWGAQPPGWRESSNESSYTRSAKQWVETLKIATSEGRKLPSENYLEVRYEDLVNHPHEEVNKIAGFLDLEEPELVASYALRTADPSRINKWKSFLDQDVLDEVEQIMKPTMSQFGYTWRVSGDPVNFDKAKS